MKKSIALVMAMMFVFVLAGCGGGGSKESAQVGSWKLVSFETGGQSTDLSQLEQMGMTGILTLTEDKKASLDLFGETMSGTWEADGDSGVALTFEGTTQKGTIASGKMTLEQDGDKLVFEKTTDAPAASSPAAS